MSSYRLLLLLLGVSLSSSHAASMPASQLESYIDGVMEQAVVDGATVGATVALVQNGRLLVARGYGYADLASAIPVQARRTSFRIGSITKVLTWMSVLQQVEAGRLDLDADVNEYLRRFKIPGAFAEAVTLRHLMTHTSGFEDDITSLFVKGPRQLGTLATTLEQTVPRRLYPPGGLTAYSNYGTGLAGHLVANVSDMDWHDYIETQLFKPMRMTGAATRQPVPEALEPNRSLGYVKSLHGFEPQGFSYIPLAPAGAASATALDMARLMVELLNVNGTGILSAESKSLLRQGAYIADPAVNGMTLGMYQMSRGPVRALGHDGSTMIFHSRMVLWPDENMGLFVAVNTDTGAPLVRLLADTLSARLGFDRGGRLPVVHLANSEAELNPIADGEKYVGSYHSARRNESNWTRLLVLADRLQISYLREPELLQVQDISGNHHYRQLQTGVFEQTDGTARLVFAEAGDGNIVYHSERPMAAYVRADSADRLDLNMLVLLLWLLVALSIVLYWPLSWFRRDVNRPAPVRGSWLLSLVIFASIGTVAVFFVQLLNSAENAVDFVFNGIAEVPRTLWLPLVFVLLVAIQLGFLYRVWVVGLWRVGKRIHFTAVLLVQILLVWWFWHWHLLPPVVMSVLS